MEASAREDVHQALRAAMQSKDAALLEASIGRGEVAGVSRVLLESARRRLAALEVGGCTEPDAEGQLPPLPAETDNRIAELDRGPCADPEALMGEAFYIPSLVGPPEDRTVFDRLMTELDFHTCWLNTGMQFSREICLGDDDIVRRSPTYLSIVQRVSEFFGVKVVRTLVNLYRHGGDWCNLHSDQYHQGGYPIDLTIGASFGDARRLVWVEKKNDRHQIEIPQRNGDVFAFSDRINSTWRHMVPRERQCGPRISVIVWCSRWREEDQPASLEEHSLGSFPHMLYHNPKGSGKGFVARPQYPGANCRGRGRGWRGGRGRPEGRWEGRGARD